MRRSGVELWRTFKGNKMKRLLNIISLSINFVGALLITLSSSVAEPISVGVIFSFLKTHG